MWSLIHVLIWVIIWQSLRWCHYGAIASQITSLTIVYSTVYSGADQSKHQSSASVAFVWGIHRGPVNSPHKWPVTRKMFPFDDVIMVKWDSRWDVRHVQFLSGPMPWKCTWAPQNFTNSHRASRAGDVSLTFRRLPKIFSRHLCITKTVLMRISSLIPMGSIETQRCNSEFAKWHDVYTPEECADELMQKNADFTCLYVYTPEECADEWMRKTLSLLNDYVMNGFIMSGTVFITDTPLDNSTQSFGV